jgi:hypothetical protein
VQYRFYAIKIGIHDGFRRNENSIGMAQSALKVLRKLLWIAGLDEALFYAA